MKMVKRCIKYLVMLLILVLVSVSILFGCSLFVDKYVEWEIVELEFYFILMVVGYVFIVF